MYIYIYMYNQCFILKWELAVNPEVCELFPCRRQNNESCHHVVPVTNGYGHERLAAGVNVIGCMLIIVVVGHTPITTDGW